VFNIRQAKLSDLAQITDIYNDAIVNTSTTFDTEPKTIEQQEIWFVSHGARHPILVAVDEGQVVGWSSLSHWSDRCAYADTAEISVYVSEVHRGKGIGKQLMSTTVQEGKTVGLHTIIARIAGSNRISVDLCKSFGFQYIGTMRDVGNKFGQLLDVHLMQLIY